LPYGVIEILPAVKMQIIPSPGHTPGGVMFYFPEYKILLIGDTLFQDNIGRYDMPGGDKDKLFESIHRLRLMNLDDDTNVVHGHGMETTIGWLKQNNPYFQ
jgi:glyoxylase-like metal-dependent hydrolase (beta-lactamase superfamily II)